MGKRFHTCLYLLFSCFLFINAALSQTKFKINNISISSDNSVFTERFILDNIELKYGEMFSQTKLQASISKIQNLFLNECYYEVVIKSDTIVYSSDSSNVDIRIIVFTGNQSLIEKIEIEGNTQLSRDAILERLETKSGSCANQSVLESDLDAIVTWYEGIGFPYASAKLKNISYTDSSKRNLALQIEINEGEKVKIDKIDVQGNTDTQPDVIVREIRIKPGEVFNSYKIENITKLLNRMQIFSSVNDPILYLIPDSSNGLNIPVENPDGIQTLNTPQNYKIRSGGILIKVTEGNTNTFDGVVGYMPGGVGRSGYFTGLVDVGMRNIFGTGRKLNVKWLREDVHSQELGIRYLEPWVFNYPINLSGSFFQRQQDTTYVKRITELKSDFMVFDNLTIGGLFSQENVIPSSDIANQYITSSGTTSGGIEIHYDTRDDIYNPTAGINYRSDYYVGRKKLYSTKERLSLQKFGLDVEMFYAVFKKQVVGLGLHGRDLRSDNIEVSDMYRFGGANTLRGYRENQFVGSRVVWSNAEYRFLMGRRSFFFLFFDAGYYYYPAISKSSFDSATENAKFGYGVGMRVETGLGVIGVSFALGKGDNFSQAKIHFGLINDF
jgi:outer membrane protein insertion porin family